MICLICFGSIVISKLFLIYHVIYLLYDIQYYCQRRRNWRCGTPLRWFEIKTPENTIFRRSVWFCICSNWVFSRKHIVLGLHAFDCVDSPILSSFFHSFLLWASFSAAAKWIIFVYIVGTGWYQVHVFSCGILICRLEIDHSHNPIWNE